MKTNKIAEALFHADEKYIQEYASYKNTIKKRNTLIASGIAACLCVAIALPIALGNNREPIADRIWPWEETMEDRLTAEGISLSNIEVLYDAYINFNGNIENTSGTSSQGVIAFPETLYCYLYQDTSSLLAVKGKKFRSQSYTCDAIIDGKEKKLRFTVTEIIITEMLKTNGNSGYKKGDRIYLYENYVYTPVTPGEHNEYSISGGASDGDISVNGEAVYLLSVMHDREMKHTTWKIADSLSGKDTWKITCVRTEEEYQNALKLFKESPDIFNDSLISGTK